LFTLTGEEPATCAPRRQNSFDQSVDILTIPQNAEYKWECVFTGCKQTASLFEFNTFPDTGMHEKILLIEADEDLRELMRLALEQSGYQVATAGDSSRGYDMALFLKPDLIVTDIYMRSANEVHVVRRIRNTPSLERTQVLVTTTFGNGSGTFSLQLGANAFEPKPIDSQSFLSTVRRLLNN
jgi:CheY-like chemotaxis protein